MNTKVDDVKRRIRAKILKLLKSQKEADRLKKSGLVLKALFKSPQFKQSKKILFYASFGGEVDTFEMMKQAEKLKKTIVLPVIHKSKKEITPRAVSSLKNGLTVGPFGIQEPRLSYSHEIALDELDLVLVPGIAFDKNNRRLGRGQGYYDRFIARLPKSTPTIGLAFDFQIVDSLPFCPDYDQAVSCVITN